MKRILQRMFNKSNLLVVNIMIEENEQGVKEKIFFEFYQDYERSKAIKMSLKLFDLRQLKYALQEVIKTGNTNFTKFTESKGIKKSLTVNQKFITARNITENYYIGFAFENYYELLAFKDEVDFFIRTIENKMQNYYKEKNNGN